MSRVKGTERRKRLHAEIFRIITEAKDRPCADCGLSFPTVCMDFDHLPHHEKSFTIGSPSNWTSIPRIKREIAKCEVVCSNCHRIRTHDRKNGLTTV